DLWQRREDRTATRCQRDAIVDAALRSGRDDLRLVVETRFEHLLRDAEGEHADEDDRQDRDDEAASDERASKTRTDELARRSGEPPHQIALAATRCPSELPTQSRNALTPGRSFA